MPDNWIVVGEAAKPYDGRYPLVMTAEFNARELGWAKRYAGRLPADIDEGLDGLDAELFVVLALVAMSRAGKIQPTDIPDVFERLSDAPFIETFKLEGAPAEEEASPPPPSSDVNGGSSGPGSPKSSPTSVLPPKHSGMPASVTSPSDQPTSVT